jgi:hypothetical protein
MNYGVMNRSSDWLRAERPKGRSSVSVRIKNFHLFLIVQTGCGAYPVFHQMGTGGSFPGVKWQGREADRDSSDVTSEWPCNVSIAHRLHVSSLADSDHGVFVFLAYKTSTWRNSYAFAYDICRCGISYACQWNII